MIGSLVGSEVLKLVRRRGLMWTALAFMVGSVVLILVVRAFQYDSTGGEDGYRGCMYAIISLGGLVATAIGATAGSGDHSAGVFRDLVATGIARWKLFAVRMPGALVVVAALVTPAYLIAVAAGLALGANSPDLTWSIVRDDLGYLVLLLFTLTVLGVALSTVAGSRGWVIGGLIVFEWVLQPLLTHLNALGSLRSWLLGPAVDSFARSPLERYGDYQVGAGHAAFTIVLWMVAACALGGWWVTRRDA